MNSRITKSTTPRLNPLQISAESLPGAISADALPGVIFFSLADLREGCHDALTERWAIDEYHRDGVEEALHETLHGLGWDYADIAAVARGSAMVTSYGRPTA